jgi:hypothetical protein
MTYATSYEKSGLKFENSSSKGPISRNLSAESKSRNQVEV